MAHDRTFRFGVQLSNATSAADWAEKARRIESMGYATLYMPDHFGEQLAPVPALAAAAAATTSLRVGALVFGNDYKHPVVLAKELATLDVLTGGRLDVGLGAGWMQTDYDEAGLRYDPPGVRVSRLEEALQVIKGLLGDGPFSFAGEHYTIQHHNGYPKPVQRPRPPILVGGGGKRVLAIAGREADIVGINPNLRAGQIDGSLGPDLLAETSAQKVAWVREAAGDRFDDLELSTAVFMVSVTDDRDTVAGNIGSAFGLDAEQALGMLQVLIGTEQQMIDELRARRDRYGISHIVVNEAGYEALSPIVGALAGT